MNEEDVSDYGGVRVHVDTVAIESEGDIEFNGVAFKRLPDDPVAAESSPPDMRYVAYTVSRLTQIEWRNRSFASESISVEGGGRHGDLPTQLDAGRGDRGAHHAEGRGESIRHRRLRQELLLHVRGAAAGTGEGETSRLFMR